MRAGKPKPVVIARALHRAEEVRRLKARIAFALKHRDAVIALWKEDTEGKLHYTFRPWA